MIKNNKNNMINGIYVHLKLVHHIASWVSVDYAILVSNVVLMYHKE